MKLTIQSEGRALTIGTLPAGDAGIAATVAAIQALVDDAISTPALRRRLQMIGGAGAFDPEIPGDAARLGAALYKFLGDSFQFTKDRAGLEYVRTPADMLAALDGRGKIAGDCDDMATLAAAVLASVGFLPVLVTVGRLKPGRFEHIFTAVRLRPGAPLERASLYALDAQERSGQGIFPNVPRVKLWGLRPSLVG